MSRLILVRHAEPVEDARGLCYGSLDFGLSPAGLEHALRIAEALAGTELPGVVGPHELSHLLEIVAALVMHRFIARNIVAYREPTAVSKLGVAVSAEEEAQSLSAGF